MKYRYLVYLTLAVIALSIAVLPVSAQKRIGVVKLDVSRTSVYRGYQSIEIVAYMYTGDVPARPTLTRATATLTAGLSISLSFALVELISPTTIVVDGVEHIVQFLALVRVPVPEAMFTGKGTLRIDIAGRAAGVDFTFVRDIVLEIADHRPILAARTEVQASLERVRGILTLASALGVDVSEHLRELSEIESIILGASEKLDLYGEVEEALSLYREALASLASLEGKVVSALAIRYGGVESRISVLESRASTLEASLTQTIKSVEDLSKALATTIAQLEKGIEDVSKRSMEAISALAKHMEDYSKKVDESLSTLAKSVDSALKSMAESNRKATEAALKDLASRIETLDKSVAELADSQKDLATRISDISNTTQIALVVVATMLLASIAVMKFIK